MISGTVLHYEILEKLGEGGMGEVYKAHDTKLDRFVALKFLPSHLTATEDEKARFIQEAKAASQLNHPNVCTIHDIQEYENQLFIVMEYIEGETLRAKNKSLSVKQIIDIGAQTADGLAAAHEKGIVHRDIKPENIMVRKDGIVQIMDFGLAKLRETSEVSRLTKAGTTMGTMGYMSPEQVQGQDVDYRTDIFSLGVVLYELLSGEPTFKGVHETAVMYEIVNVDPPPLTSLKPEIDPELDNIILECLQKDRDDRIQSAKELARNLRKVRKGSTGRRTSRTYDVNSGITNVRTTESQAVRQSGVYPQEEIRQEDSLIKGIFGKRAPLTLVVLLLVGLVVLSALYFLKSSGITMPELQSSILPPPGLTFNNQRGSNLAISPNGKYIAFIGSDSSGTTKLWLRPTNSMNGKILTDAQSNAYPFWSPDSKSIGYFLSGKLMKVAIDGGPPLAVCDAQSGRGGTWNKEGTIVFAPFAAGGLYEVSSGGGKPELIVKSDSSKKWLSPRWPFFLPDGKHFLFSIQSSTSGSGPNDGIYVASLDDPKPHLVLRASSNTEYSDGYIFFVRQSILLAQPFDPGSLKLSGQITPLTDNVQYYDVRISGTYSVSQNGLLIYEKQVVEDKTVELMNSEGKVLNTLFRKPVWQRACFSPDDKVIAFDSYDANERNFDIWTHDIASGVTTRLTFNHAADAYPVWSPDGKQIAFTSSRTGNNLNVYVKNSDGSDRAQPLFLFDNTAIPTDWSRDGKYILITAFNYVSKKSGGDLLILPTFGDRKPEVFLGTDFNEVFGKFSPDGKWISYISDESGRSQVYVSPVSGGSKWQVSVNGGGQSWWVDNGKKLFFLSLDNKVMGVDVTEEGSVLTFGRPYMVFDLRKTGEDVTIYDINSSGNEFLAAVSSGKSGPATITMVTNWKAELQTTK